MILTVDSTDLRNGEQIFYLLNAYMEDGIGSAAIFQQLQSALNRHAGDLSIPVGNRQFPLSRVAAALFGMATKATRTADMEPLPFVLDLLNVLLPPLRRGISVNLRLGTGDSFTDRNLRLPPGTPVFAFSVGDKPPINYLPPTTQIALILIGALSREGLWERFVADGGGWLQVDNSV